MTTSIQLNMRKCQFLIGTVQQMDMFGLFELAGIECQFLIGTVQHVMKFAEDYGTVCQFLIGKVQLLEEGEIKMKLTRVNSS